MKVRTPARRRRSSFCDRFARVGVQGYSHATSKGVAQYELGKGRLRWMSEPEENEMVGRKEVGLPHMAREEGDEEDSSEQDIME